MKKMDYKEAALLLEKTINPVETEDIPIEKCLGRVLGSDITAAENVPSFDRSPYDGYAFRAEDTIGASETKPVTLQVVENIRAGQMPAQKIESGLSTRLMTGAPIPEGANAVCKYEDTEFTEESVTIKNEYKPGDNVVTAGEDIRFGTVVLNKGYRIDAGMMGTLASLGIMTVPVHRTPVAGILSTGDEVVEAGEFLPPGKIRNSNRYTIAAALESIGVQTVYLGQAADTVEDICRLIREGEDKCDMLISTGGVSVGDYDLVPDAMKECGYEIPVRGVAMKPGMACAYGIKKEDSNTRLMLGLSGNPASSLTNLQCVCYPAIKKMMGLDQYEHQVVQIKVGDEIKKGAGKGTRFVRGRIAFRDGDIFFDSPSSQGNVVISSAARCDAYGVISGLKAPIKTGTKINVFSV